MFVLYNLSIMKGNSDDEGAEESSIRDGSVRPGNPFAIKLLSSALVNIVKRERTDTTTSPSLNFGAMLTNEVR